VTGMAALVLSRFPVYSRQELFDILINSVDAMGFDLPIGNGRINLSRAVQMDQPLPTARVSVSETVSGFVDVSGTAAGTFFSGYSLNIGAGRTPTNWVQISSSTLAVTNGFLGRLDSALVTDGPAVVQLVVSNLNGAAAVATAPMTVFNAMITEPMSTDILAPGRYVVRGTVHGTGKSYDLFYGVGSNPSSWTKIASGGTGKIDAPLGEWDASELPSGFYALKLRITNHGQSSEFTAPLIYIEPKLKAGWPVYVETDADFPATEWRNVRPADLDGNGVAELVLVDAGTRGRKQVLRVFSLNGEELWSRELGYDIPPDLAAIGDVNGDGRKEIFVDATNGLIAFRHDGSVLPGWPVATETSNHAKVLADVDGDGAPELISYSQEYAATQVAESRELSVFKQDGTLLKKWILPWCGFTNDVQKIFPTVANLDDDAALEIIVPSGCSELIAFDLENAEPKWRAPVTGKILSSPVAGDVDGNGAVDIVVAVAAVNPGSAAGVYLFDRFGQRWIGWPVLEEFSFVTAPALGDLDQDGRLEIVVVHDQVGAAMHLLESDGFQAEGWPQYLFQNTSSRIGISIADINNDGLPEIVTSVPGYVGLTLSLGQNFEYVGGIVARDRFGKVVSLNGNHFVKSLPFESVAQSRSHKSAPVVIGDMDGNGRLDLVLGSILDRTFGSLRALKQRSSIYAWELPASGTVEWGMFGHDVANSGAYSLPLFPAPVPTNVTRAIRDRVLTLEDRALQIHATTNDWNATAAPLSIINFTTPTNGTVTLLNDSVLNYQPNPDFSGFDSFTYLVRDSEGTTSSAPVIVRVKPVNDAPVAESIALTMNKNSSVDVFYNAQDAESTAFTFRIVTPPQHGELWNYPSVGTYYPTPGYFGTDSFSYVANDGELDSVPAMVNITILNSNNPPKAIAQNLLTKTNRSLLISPGGTDSDGDPLTYEIVTAPQSGTAIQVGTQFRYTPELNYVGEVSFTFRAFDGTAHSAEAAITIGIIATNAAPRARESTVTVQPNTESPLRLSGSDPDGDSVTFEVLTEPLHGQLSGEPPNLTYLPRTNYLGPDRFEFRVTDGFATSDPAVFTIQVVRENRPPKAIDQVVAAELNLPASFALNASDPDDDPVRVIILKGPRSGVLYGSGTNITYAPRTSAVSFDSFTYKLWDGQRFGNVARVSVNLSEPGEENPPVFTSIQTVDGILRLNLTVTEREPFRIEASTDLTEWFILLPTTTANASTFQFHDTNTSSKMRYYRAVAE
ncbi:MAG: Ig-like domain-containing protein, partial [Limisphaerales bacterium]